MLDLLYSFVEKKKKIWLNFLFSVMVSLTLIIYLNWLEFVFCQNHSFYCFCCCFFFSFSLVIYNLCMFLISNTIKDEKNKNKRTYIAFEWASVFIQNIANRLKIKFKQIRRSQIRDAKFKSFNWKKIWWLLFAYFPMGLKSIEEFLRNVSRYFGISTKITQYCYSQKPKKYTLRF